MTISNLLQARCLIFAIYLAMRPVGRRVGQVVSDGPEVFEPLSVVLKVFEITPPSRGPQGVEVINQW